VIVAVDARTGEPTWEKLGGTVEVIEPDAASSAAFGTDPLAPEVRTPSAEAGYAQGRSLVAAVGAMWG
jgi:NTE family protein